MKRNKAALRYGQRKNQDLVAFGTELYHAEKNLPAPGATTLNDSSKRISPFELTQPPRNLL